MNKYQLTVLSTDTSDQIYRFKLWIFIRIQPLGTDGRRTDNAALGLRMPGSGRPIAN
jgi:hypothetical protein